MRTRSIRVRITVLATILALLVLSLASLVVVTVQRSQLIANLDSSLSARADQLGDQLSGEPAIVPNTNAEDRFVQLLASDGSVISATENVTGLRVFDTGERGDHFETRSGLALEDDSFRVLARGREDGTTLVVGENIDDQNDAIRGLMATSAAIVPIASIVLAAITWGLVGRTLRPVEDIRAEVAALGHRELDRRVPVPPSGDEIARLATTMNDMLDRLETSSLRQQQFVADVSHELRSPIARMRTMIEVELAADDPDLELAASSALEDAVQLQGTIDDLLYLARADAGQTSLRRSATDLDVVVAEEIARVRVAADVPVSMTDVSGATAYASRTDLQRVVRNLLENAVRHATSRTSVSLRSDPTTVELIVDDDGAGIPVEDRRRVFDRFTRLDEARNTAAGGTGLGLAIVDEVVRAHEGDVRIEDSPLGGARFVVTLPASPTADAQTGEP